MPATNVAWGGATVTVKVNDVDVSCDFLFVRVDKSKNHLWDAVDTGTVQIQFDLSAAGVASDTGSVGVSVTVDVAYAGVSRRLFTGSVKRRRQQVTPEADVLILDCVDGMDRLAQINRRPLTGDPWVGDGEAIDQRIARWLDEANYTSRLLDSSTYTAPPVQMGGNALVEIRRAAQADGGDFYIDGDGVATFKSFAWRQAPAPTQAIFSDRRLYDWVPYSSANLHEDLDEVQNSVTGIRRERLDPAAGGDPVPQSVEDTGSVTLFGKRGDALSSLELLTDTQVGNRVAAVVGIAGGPNERFDAIVVQPAFDPPNMWPAVIPVQFASLVGANRLWPDGSETALYGHVMGEQWTISPTDITVTYRCSGTGTWDGTMPPRPPPDIAIDAAGCISIPPGLPCDDTSDVVVRDDTGTVLATYPPGSLCFPNKICNLPQGTVEVCFTNAHGTACHALDLHKQAVLWLTLQSNGLSMVEKIHGDHPADWPLYGIDDANPFDPDAIPGGYDAINADATGGSIAQAFSPIVLAADFSGGWTIDLWWKLPSIVDYTGGILIYDIVDLVTLKLQCWVYTPSHDPRVYFHVTTTSDDGDHEAHVVDDVPVDTTWYHYVFTWDGTTIHTLRDGVEI